MDLGLYNKKSEPRGEHGTLIGNWVEERALQQATGFTRYEDLSLEKKALDLTQDRVLSHPYGAPTSMTTTTQATYVAHGNDNFTPKIFNQTGSHWHHDLGEVTRPAKRKDMQSQISFGNHTSTYSSTSSSSFLHPSVLIPPVQTPLALQPRPKVDYRAQTFAEKLKEQSQTTKLDRPYSVDQ